MAHRLADFFVDSHLYSESMKNPQKSSSSIREKNIENLDTNTLTSVNLRRVKIPFELYLDKS